LLEAEVTDLIRDGDTICGVVTSRGAFHGRWVVIAAGLWADALMRKAGLDGFSLRPRKGEYFVLDRVAAEQVHSVLFPCPTPVSKGILVTRTIHGNVMLGPNAMSVSSPKDLTTTSAGLNEVMTGALKLMPGLNARQVIRTFAGLRASGGDGDFVIDAPKEHPGLVVLAGIDSPGLTASPAIADHVVELLRERGLRLMPRADFQPERKAVPRFSLLDHAKQAELIAHDPRYGRVICRCETVTEGEIVAACHSVVPARTYDALKRRTRVGTGRCQGAFDLPLVIEIMARELGISPLELTQNGGGSRLLVRPTKEVGA
jgi:glycerol-3-phosphate dehydrogenase